MGRRLRAMDQRRQTGLSDVSLNRDEPVAKATTALNRNLILLHVLKSAPEESLACTDELSEKCSWVVVSVTRAPNGQPEMAPAKG